MADQTYNTPPQWVQLGNFNLPTFHKDYLDMGGKTWLPAGGTSSDGGAAIGDPSDPNAGSWQYGGVGLKSDYWDKYGGMLNGMGQYSNNWMTNMNDDGSFNLTVKSGDKVGSNFKYKQVGDYWVPDLSTGKNQRWDTNNNWGELATAIATAATMAFAGPTLAGLGGALEAGAMPTLSQIGGGLNLLNTTTGGSIPGLREAGLATSFMNSGAGLVNGVSSGVNSLSDIAKLGKSGFDVYNKGSKLMDMFSGPDEQYANSTYGSGGSNFAPQPAEGGSGFDISKIFSGGLPNVLGGVGSGRSGLLDLWGAWEGSRQAKDEAGNLKQLYTDALTRRQPYIDRLQASYTDPNTFYGSEQWKGLSDVYQNNIDRQAARSGRMANPSDREVMLQKYAMQELNNYRSGLNNTINNLSPNYALNPMVAGLRREAGANNPWGALGGRGGVGGPGMGKGGGDLYSMFSGLAKAFGGAQNIPPQLMKLFDSSNPNYGSPEGGFESDYPTGGGDLGSIWSNPGSFVNFSQNPFTAPPVEPSYSGDPYFGGYNMDGSAGDLLPPNFWETYTDPSQLTNYLSGMLDFGTEG